MSVNPAAVNGAAASANVSAAVEQLIAAELDALAADAQALQSQVTTGQVVQAQVLPSNGLTDLIQILGNRVAAALPPGLAPGDLFTAQVTGFNGPQILLTVLNTVDPALLTTAPPPPGLTSSTLPPPSEESPPSALELAATRPMLPDGITPSIAPPPAVFVAASVRPAAGLATTPVTLPPTLPAGGAAVQPPANAAPPAAALSDASARLAASATEPGPATLPPPPPPSQVIAQPLVGLADIEARLAAARAGSISINVPVAPPPANAAAAPANLPPPPQPGAPSPAPPATANGAAPATNAQPPPVPAGRFTFAPPITPSARFSENAPPPGPATTTPAAPAPSGPAAYRDPTALVRALNLPVTPSNVAAARLAIDTPQRLPAALATLESALPEADDPRVTTLRTLTAFLTRIEPSSPQLAAQISAYVDNVVTGNEPKLAALLSAQLTADAQAAPPAADATEQAPASTTPGTTATPAAPSPVAAEPALPVVALAQIIERGAALAVDLKTQVLALINAPPPGSEDAGTLVPAASSALTAITAVQLNAAQAMSATPQTMAFTIPMWVGSGYAQARIAIDRDAPQASNRNLDGDNFHIAFILDTKNLGTVSVDLQTVGRAFSLAVKTENEGSAKVFAQSLAKLTARLETLRYRVNSAEASVAPRGVAPVTAPEEPAAVEPEPEDDDGVGSDVNVRA